jgi:hypothetical protein
MPKQLVFLCGARDFHAMDWYRSAKEIFRDKEIFILTDLIAGEGYKNLILKNDIVFKLLIIDKFLLNKQSAFGNKWRNIVKLLVFPFQIILIRKFSKKYPDAIYHAHSMYYLFLAWASGIPYIGTPQGSDILIKPFKSKLYKYFTIKSIIGARAITVDSNKMKEKIIELTGINAYIIQNGIDISSIEKYKNAIKTTEIKRDVLLSIRGLTSLYRIKELVNARNSSMKFSSYPLTFIYPFQEESYLDEFRLLLKQNDVELGRIERSKMYELLMRSNLVFSIPLSDSSPRSVYEAIFCGCCVAVTYNTYIDTLPACMKARLFVVNLAEKDWFDKAIAYSSQITKTPYEPSEEALDLFDQKKSMEKVSRLFFSTY